MRTLEWIDSHNRLKLIDQRLLPGRLEYYVCHSLSDVGYAIAEMVVRGAPAIGVTAAFGLALAGLQSHARKVDTLRTDLEQAARLLIATRPTAVNLAWALNQMLQVAAQPADSADELRQRLLQAALAMAEADIETNRRMAEFGASLINDGDVIIHHCNTGSLAAVDWGTALGAIRLAHAQGKHIQVLVDETRPRLQGARLTAWELQQYGIPFHIIADGAAGHFLHTHQANMVMFGSDRVAANGDVVNKIGSYMLALAAVANNVPVYPVFPTSTVDLSLPSGDAIIIEERDPSEVLEITIRGERATPQGASALNPAFDLTPHHLLTALVTERGIVYPPFDQNLPRLMAQA